MSHTSLVYEGVKFDSDEEVFFAMWLEELKKAGLVQGWLKMIHPIILTPGLKIPYKKQTVLKTKTKIEDKELTLLRPSEYTPDFYVSFSSAGEKVFNSPITHKIEYFNPKALFFYSLPTNSNVYFEVKPSFDQNNMERLFINNQKFIWDKLGIFVNLIEPVELFKKTFLPKEAAPYFRYKVLSKKALFKGKKKGDFKFDWTPKTLKEYLNLQ